VTIKDLALKVPRPYRKWYARALLVVAGPFLVIAQAAVDGFKWCREVGGEVVYLWKDAGTW